MDNNMKFNQMLNSSPHGRKIYELLCVLAAKPIIQQTNDISEKRQIIVGELLSILNKAQGNQQAI